MEQKKDTFFANDFVDQNTTFSSSSFSASPPLSSSSSNASHLSVIVFVTLNLTILLIVCKNLLLQVLGSDPWKKVSRQRVVQADVGKEAGALFAAVATALAQTVHTRNSQCTCLAALYFLSLRRIELWQKCWFFKKLMFHSLNGFLTWKRPFSASLMQDWRSTFCSRSTLPKALLSPRPPGVTSSEYFLFSISY